MTDEEALATALKLLDTDVPKPGPTWLSVVDLCFWVKDVSKRLPKPKKNKNEYMKEYMRLWRAKKKLANQLTPTRQPLS